MAETSTEVQVHDDPSVHGPAEHLPTNDAPEPTHKESVGSPPDVEHEQSPDDLIQELCSTDGTGAVWIVRAPLDMPGAVHGESVKNEPGDHPLLGPDESVQALHLANTTGESPTTGVFHLVPEAERELCGESVGDQPDVKVILTQDEPENGSNEVASSHRGPRRKAPHGESVTGQPNTDFILIPNASGHGRDKLGDVAGYTYVVKREGKTIINWRLYYGNGLLLGCNVTDILKLQPIQDWAAKLVFKLSKYDHAILCLRQLHWIPVDRRCSEHNSQFLCNAAVVQHHPDTFSPVYPPHCHRPEPRVTAIMRVLREVNRALQDSSVPLSMITTEALQAAVVEGGSVPSPASLANLQHLVSRVRCSSQHPAAHPADAGQAEDGTLGDGWMDCSSDGSGDSDGDDNINNETAVTESAEGKCCRNEDNEGSPSVQIMFQCEYCAKVFSGAESLWQHKESCPGRELHQCEYCLKVLPNFRGLQKHQNIYTIDKPYQLGYCEKGFVDSVKSSEVDTTVMHSDGSSKVNGDIGVTENRSGYDEQSANKMQITAAGKMCRVEGVYKCDLCEETFSKDYQWKEHKKAAHPKRRPYKCDVCNKTFATKANTRDHMVIHTGAKPFPCRQCEQAFGRRGDRRKHEKLHWGLEPFHCEYCDSTFTDNAGLRAHLPTHFSATPLHCDECDQDFKTRWGFKYHMRIHIEGLSCRCDTCGKAFRRNTALIRHKKTHEKKAPFKCYMCYEEFDKIVDFTDHKMKHSVVKSHQCDVCGSMFRMTSHLRDHKKMHTDERLHQCDICGKAYRRSTTLRKHKMTHSKETVPVKGDDHPRTIVTGC